jgi:outer membrane lipoprotein SlyB
MKILFSTITAVALVLSASSALAQQAGQSVSLQYGKVVKVDIVEDPGQRAGGTVVGGLAGAALARDHRGLGAIAGGLIGGGIEKHATKKMLQQYTVELRGDAGATVVLTEQHDLVVGDCVVVEQGKYANIRRVSSVNCEVQQQPAHHARDASSCDKAKDELVAAKTDEAVQQAVTKVRTLCED